MDLIIEDNIPMPEKYHGTFAALVRQIQPGQSVYIDTYPRREALRNAFRIVGKRCATRKEGKGHRVWCLADEEVFDK